MDSFTNPHDYGPVTAGLGTEYKAGLDLALANGWLWLHESRTYVKITEAGAELFA